MISITTPTYDLQGQAIIRQDPDSVIRGNTRRLTRTATLDGGCAITDQGFSHADRTLEVKQDGISQADSDRLWYLFRTYALVNISMADGAFAAAIKNMKIEKGRLQASILIKEKIS